MIVKFSNRYLEQHERVKLISALGHAKEKPTVAMPREMVGILTQHVVSQARSFEPLEENCIGEGALGRLGKYLGK